MTGGLLLIAAALLLTCYNLWDERRATNSAGEALRELETLRPEEPETVEETEIPDYLLDPGREMPAVEIDGGRYIGVLELPSLGLELPVMESWSYPNLRVAPCRYGGSAYQDDLIIAAHNYASHFGRLKELKSGTRRASPTRRATCSATPWRSWRPWGSTTWRRWPPGIGI